MKGEVQEAWNNYRSAQEKAATIESDLQDEIKILQKAKLQDKQQAVAQISKMNDEITELMKQLQNSQSQKSELLQQLAEKNTETLEWEKRVESLQAELADAQNSSMQGVSALREEIKALHQNTERLRNDHGAVVRQSQVRQAEIERELTELANSLASKEKEVYKLQEQVATLSELKGNGNNSSAASYNNVSVHSYASRDYIQLQQELAALASSLDKERQKNEDIEQRYKSLERDARVAQINLDDEKKRSRATIDELNAKINQLEGELHSHRDSKGASKSGESMDLSETSKQLRELEEQRAQNQNLSKLLLKKQSAVLELQAERSALKSQIIDLQTR